MKNQNGSLTAPGDRLAARPDAVAAETEWHTLPVGDVFGRLGSDARLGLSPGEAVRRLAEVGPNTLVESRGRSALAIFVDQFKSIIVGLLLAATLLAFAPGEPVEGRDVLVVLMIIAALGFLTE
jgi:Ca2+-transporting ATPase